MCARVAIYQSDINRNHIALSSIIVCFIAHPPIFLELEFILLHHTETKVIFDKLSGEPILYVTRAAFDNEIGALTTVEFTATVTSAAISSAVPTSPPSFFFATRQDDGREVLARYPRSLSYVPSAGTLSDRSRSLNDNKIGL